MKTIYLIARDALQVAGLAALALTGACSVGPAYKPPVVEPPSTFKEATDAAGRTWSPAQPGDASDRGEWWRPYGDPELDALEARVDVSSQTIAQADAQFRQARALVKEGRSQYYPTVTVSPSITEQHVSVNRSDQLSRSASLTQFSLPVDASYEADVWGRIRQTVAMRRADAQASAADLEGVRLSVHAEVAADYLQLRALDAEGELLRSSVEAFERAAQLTSNRYNAGVASRGDVAQAQAQLEATRAQAIDVGVQRAQLEHAIGVLVGEVPSGFSLVYAPLTGEAPPTVPLALPSLLLQRRPDIAAAERRVASANAQVGIAATAFFPTVLLTASGGFQGSRISDWFSLPSRFWSIGPSLAQTIFDGGARAAAREEARAGYDAAVAAYRQSVLGAFGDVEDNLAELHILADESRTQEAAVAAARQSTAIALNQYRTGLVSYLQVVTAQSEELTDERAALTLLARRYMASVQLVKALGGGWDVSQLPTDPK